MTSWPMSAVVSLASWISLWFGLAGLCVAASAARLSALESVTNRRDQLRQSIVETQAEVDRLQRITNALRTNEVFRSQWLRDEWGQQATGQLEVIAVRDSTFENSRDVESRLPTTSTSPTTAERSWYDPLRPSDRLIVYVVPVSILLICLGVIGPVLSAPRSPAVVRAMRRLARFRYQGQSGEEQSDTNLAA